jgi:NADH-quinone oxidoreductase subunit L
MLGIFLLGLMFTYTQSPISLNIDEIRHVVVSYDWWAVNLGWLPTAAALLIFLGAVGKSAQFPLHVWLPDAMEGPTPVSALIHAATMVAAGVFLVARFFWLFELSPTAMLTVAWIGAITAFGAATIGVTQYDIKRILAYSTISQLGYMMIGLGVGAVSAGIFHLLTHAYFKALLFLGSGAVIYGCRHIQDIRYMGGLSKRMPITYVTFLAGTLALAGVFPFAGFWSKDEILGGAFQLAQHGYRRIVEIPAGEEMFTYTTQVIAPNWGLLVIWVLGLAGAFLTAFYMFRLMSYVFLAGPKGDYEYRAKQSPDYGHHPKGEADTKAYEAWPTPPGPFEEIEHHHGPIDPKEVPSSMWVPLAILALFSLLFGFIGMPFLGEQNLVSRFLHHGHPHFPVADSQTLGLMLVSLVVALLGVHFGLKINNTEAGVVFKNMLKAGYPKLYRAVYNKYYVDEFYEEYVIQPVFFIVQVARAFDNYIVDGLVNAAGWLAWQFSMLQGWWDNNVVDGLVNAVAWVVGFLSDLVKPIQSGYVQNYMMVIIVFVLFYLLTLFVR